MGKINDKNKDKDNGELYLPNILQHKPPKNNEYRYKTNVTNLRDLNTGRREPAGDEVVHFLFELFASRKTTLHLYQAPEMRQLKRFSKNGIYAVSEYLDMLRKT